MELFSLQRSDIFHHFSSEDRYGRSTFSHSTVFMSYIVSCAEILLALQSGDYEGQVLQ